MSDIFVEEFPKTALNRKSGDVYDAANSGPVSLLDHGKSRYVIMSRRIFDAGFSHANPLIARNTADIPDDEAALLTAELNKIIASDD